MSGLGLGRDRWRIVESGVAAVAERDALGTTARLAIWPASSLRPAVGAVDRELSRLDLAASRFRADSEVSRLRAQDGRPVEISAGLAEAISVALAAAEWSGGLVDPTVGAAMIALGYDRDFVQVRERHWDHRPLSPAAVPGWAAVQLDGLRIRVPRGVLLDLGATAKGLGADWSARAAFAAGCAGGVLVSLGGDVAAAGDSPQGGWPILIADEHRQSARSTSCWSPTQLVRLTRGGLATSSTACRQWRRAGRTLHHIIDPRTGLPAAGPWRTVSTVAATCAEANAASTAAIILGADAACWLAARGIPARLVGRDGSVLRVGGWPAGEGGQVTPPADGWLRSGGELATESGVRR
jgi:FAD:protein FMN transferase